MLENPEELYILPACSEQVDILYQDEQFLLINKPHRLLSVPGRHPLNRDSVIARLHERFPAASIVHRLDFDTSGIMVIPLTKHALSNISRQFQARSINKTYTALVSGVVALDNGIIDLPIAADQDNRPKYKICGAVGKPSLTEYKVLMRDVVEQTTRLELHPVTGRSHQLRLHLQAIGHPILGCEFYADEIALKKSPRLLLHATRLSFLHPVNNQVINGHSQPPF